MIRALRVIFGVLAVLLAGLMMIVGALASVAVFAQHKLDPFEREHLEVAVRFLRAREAATGAIPTAAEFDRWAKAMDSQGYFRFDGHGYTLDKGCGSDPSQFCIRFWTGDAFVSYRSWQASLERVRLEHSPLILMAGSLIAAVLGAMAGKAVLAGREAHEGSQETPLK